MDGLLEAQRHAQHLLVFKTRPPNQNVDGQMWRFGFAKSLGLLILLAVPTIYPRYAQHI
jgi:hypothetical protein